MGTTSRRRQQRGVSIIEGLVATVDRATWELPAIFGLVQQVGGLAQSDVDEALNALPPLVAAVLSGVLAVPVIRGLLAVSAVGYLTGLISLVPAIATATGTLPPEMGSPWLLSVSAIGTCAAAVAWRPAVAWLYLGGAVVALGLESVLKLVALLAIGLYAALSVRQAGTPLLEKMAQLPPPAIMPDYLTMVALGAISAFTLPHQFHVGVDAHGYAPVRFTVIDAFERLQAK